MEGAKEMFSTLASYLNSQFSLLQNAEFFLRLIVASICGACIGIERTKRFKEAGVRTHMIVCCAAALMMIVSKYAFGDLTTPLGEAVSGTKGVDASRIASQVVSGVSFLGAGVIFKNGNSIKGLTTAAGIWATSGIGLAVGAGMYPVGILATVIIAVFQIVMHKYAVGADAYTTNRIVITVADTDAFRRDLNKQLIKWNAAVQDSRITRHSSGNATYDITLRMSRSITFDDMQDFLDSHEDIADIRSVPSGR